MIEEGFDRILKRVSKPYQYVGNEYNACKKEMVAVSVKICLGFPDIYEIGASNFGLKLLSELINREKDFFADRFYAPQEDFISEIEKENRLLYGIESGILIKEFDIVGFSMQYELFYPTVLKMLELSGISIRNSERKENEPIVVAGGPSCYNPNPMSDFIDLFMIGDGETIQIEMLNRYKELKERGYKREEIIEELSKIEGMYCSRYNRGKIVKKRVDSIDYVNHAKRLMVPYSRSIHDRVIVELRRGCGRMCRFCQAGHVNLPIRERKSSDVIKLAKEMVANTGYDEVSLLSLSSNDYNGIESVLEELSEYFCAKNVSISLPSQRMDKFSIEIAKATNSVRKTTMTLAIEAGSERLRGVINKNLKEDQIIETIMRCYENGYSRFKIYMMIGLPSESKEDLDKTIELFEKIFEEGKNKRKELCLGDSLKINCSISIFVPKPFTPFQWLGQASFEEIEEKEKYLRDRSSRMNGLRLNFHNKKVSQLEAVLSRGDESLNDLVYRLYKEGNYLISWEERFDYDKINKISGFSLSERALKRYEIDEELPWDFISCGIDKSWFADQYRLSLEAKNIDPCESVCVDCGVCRNLRVKKELNRDKIEKSSYKLIEENSKLTTLYIRTRYAKRGDLKYISHLDLNNTIVKILYRSGLPVEFTKGFNPLIKLSFSSALPLYIESETEFFDFQIRVSNQEIERYTNSFVLNILCENSIKNLEIKEVEISKEKFEPFEKKLCWGEYRVEILDKSILQNDFLLYIKNKILSEDFSIEKRTKRGEIKRIRVKDSIKCIEVIDGGLEMILKVNQSADILPLRADVLLKGIVSLDRIQIIRKRFYNEEMEIV